MQQSSPPTPPVAGKEIEMSITFTTGEFGKINLADGSHVRLIQQAYSDSDNASDGAPSWFAAGYLSTEDEAEETGPTVKVAWASLGNDEAEDDADWDSPTSVTHYSLGDLAIAAEVETETWEAWLDGRREEAVSFEVPLAGTCDVAAAGAAALGVDVSESLNVQRV